MASLHWNILRLLLYKQQAVYLSDNRIHFTGYFRVLEYRLFELEFL